MNLLRKYYTKLTRRLPPWEAASNVHVPITEGEGDDLMARAAAAGAFGYGPTERVQWTQVAGECTVHGGCILCRLEALEDAMKEES